MVRLLFDQGELGVNGGFASRCGSGYRRLEKRLGGGFWRIQTGRWVRTEAIGRAGRHLKGRGVRPPPPPTPKGRPLAHRYTVPADLAPPLCHLILPFLTPPPPIVWPHPPVNVRSLNSSVGQPETAVGASDRCEPPLECCLACANVSAIGSQTRHSCPATPSHRGQRITASQPVAQGVRKTRHSATKPALNGA